MNQDHIKLNINEIRECVQKLKREILDKEAQLDDMIDQIRETDNLEDEEE